VELISGIICKTPSGGRCLGCTGNDALAGKEITVARAQEKRQVKRQLGIIRYLRETRAELKKVSWPTRDEALRLTYIVLGVTVAFAVFLGMLDWVFTQIFQLLLS
jgi:preprotein translocase subunit SecE